MEIVRLTAERLPRATTAEPVYELELPGGHFTIARAQDGAYLVDHPYYGRYSVAGDGSRLECAPGGLEDWIWQRFLVGQLLPLASLLNGYEPLHASAVDRDGRAALIMGASGAGKSSVALHLAAGPAGFLADDVSALEARDGVVVVHRGPALTSVDANEMERLPADAMAGWARVGSAGREIRLAGTGSRERNAVPVAGVYVLARRRGAAGIEVAEPTVPAPGILLGGTFIGYVQGPERLVRQLEVAALLARVAPVYEVRMPPGAQAADVAAAIARTHV